MRNREKRLRAPVTEEHFHAFTDGREERFELVEGEIMMQAGATRAHERIAKRVFASLFAAVDDTVFDVNKGDFGVRVAGGARPTILYPDVVVDLPRGPDSERATDMPVVIVEVLSPSTDHEHHVRKLERYKACRSLRHYLVFAQDRPLVHLWTSTEGHWPGEPERFEGPEARIDLPAIGAALSLAEIYRAVAAG